MKVSFKHLDKHFEQRHNQYRFCNYRHNTMFSVDCPEKSQGSSVLRIVSFCVGLIVDFVVWFECSDPRQKFDRVGFCFALPDLRTNSIH